ncbi:MAG: hypothetical protein ACHQF0_03555 [Chitinophagales bacterium]
MKKINQSFFSGSSRVHHALLLCFGCLLFTGVLAQPGDVTTTATNGKTKTTCCNQLFVGPSIIFEDNNQHFNTYGVNLAFTRSVIGRLGLTADAGIHFGSENIVNYTKLQLLGGVSLLPGQDNNKLSFSPHLLGGVSSVKSKYKLETTSFGNNSTGFCMAIGTDIYFPLNNKITIAARADYNPSFASGNIINNYRVGVEINLRLGCKKPETPPVTQQDTYTREKDCEAPKDVTEVKILFPPIIKILEGFQKIINKIPDVELKISLRPDLIVRQGKECCSKDKPPATYTELKGGIEGGFEFYLTKGIPDVNVSLKLWPVLLIAELHAKLYVGPTGKINVEGVGKAYGDLLGKEPRPDCKGCLYLKIKAEGNLKVGGKIGASIKIYHWTPWKRGFDVTNDPDEEAEVSADVSFSVGHSFTGTWAGIGECEKPKAGLHGVYNIGKVKINPRFKVKLGPLQFDFTYEYPVFDGWDFTF